MADQPDTCCGTMWTLTRTREDLLQDPELAQEMDVINWRPVVDWSQSLGMFCISNVAMRFCPWCGSGLPDPIATPPKGLHITIAPTGELLATLNGEPVEPGSITRLATANEDDAPPG